MATLYREQEFGAVSTDCDWVVEQEAYYDVADGKIAWMIVLCGGYQPLIPVEIKAGVLEGSARHITL